MVNQKHFKILQQGTSVWNEWRKNYPEIRPDLKNMDIGILVNREEVELLKKLNMDIMEEWKKKGYNDFTIRAMRLSLGGLRGIDLSNTDLRKCNLWLVDLSYANLSGANLQGAYLRDTIFYRANLKYTNLRESLLRGTILTSACLDETDFSYAEISDPRFLYTDISMAKGLEDGLNRRLTPVINVSTIFLSKGHIPEIFLRNAHVPESLIAFSKSFALKIREDNESSITKSRPLKLFYCYSREDESLRDRLAKHLASLKKEGIIIEWHDREINAGDHYKQQILYNIDTSDIFLAMISPAFINSDYCYSVEMERALAKHIAGETKVVPVILRPTDWHHTPLANFQALPKDGKPIIKWESEDDALLDITNGIRKVAEKLQKKKSIFSPEISVLENKSGTDLLSLGADIEGNPFFWEALEAFRRAVLANPYNMDAWSGMAKAHLYLKQYEDTLLICEKVLNVPTETPLYWSAYHIKASALEGLGRLEEAKQIKEYASMAELEKEKKNENWLFTQRWND